MMRTCFRGILNVHFPLYLLSLLLLITSYVQGQLPAVASGRIIHLADFKSAYVNPRNIDIWLPDSYSQENKYAVLYMHDGQMLFDSANNWNHQEWGVDETAGRLIEEKKIRPCIVVGIWNGGAARHSEYFPQKPFHALPQTFQDSLLSLAKRNESTALFSGEIQSDNYLKFIVRELKPYVDSAFSTFKDPQNTFIAGSSMGGLISLYAICEYPDFFGGVACLSTHWPGTFTVENNPIPGVFMDYMKDNLPSPENHKIYFDYGTGTLDAWYEPLQKQVDKIMKHKGYNSRNWKTLKFKGEDHSETAWRKRLDIPLVFLLR